MSATSSTLTAAAASHRLNVLSLYKQFLRNATKFSNYNFREYTKRRAREGFEENRAVTDPKQLEQLVFRARQDLQVVERQATISHMYGSRKLVVE
ncbi:LYR motif-containing protein 4 [Balamuthia mandrillaris]